MKNLKTALGVAVLAAALFTSCETKDDSDDFTQFKDIPTAQEYAGIKEAALASHVQNFTLTVADGYTSLTSEKGVQIGINGGCLTLNGDAVTGEVDITFVELFDKGDMLTTNKPTMGLLPNGDKALLISGGEFLIEASQNGEKINIPCGLSLLIPADLTGGADTEMSLWEGTIDEDDNLAWGEVAEGPAGTDNGGGLETDAAGGQYYAFLQDFGWSNVDRFYSDPRPKTKILADVPEGFDNSNSSVFLSYDGEDTGLANLDTYNTDTALFSEHYGQIPIGLECHVIFVSESDGNWRYAIKSATIVADGVITFTYEETTVGTQEELVQLINNLP